MKTWIIEQSEGRAVFNSYQRADFHDYALRNPKTKYRLEPIVTNRSGLQNSLYWTFLGKIERETGNFADDLHEYFKRKFLPPRFIKINGKEIRVAGSTTQLKKLEFGDYMDKISAECGIAIPDPLEAGYIK